MNFRTDLIPETDFDHIVVYTDGALAARWAFAFDAPLRVDVSPARSLRVVFALGCEVVASREVSLAPDAREVTLIVTGRGAP